MHPSHTDKRKLKHAIEVISAKPAHIIFVPKLELPRFRGQVSVLVL
jgi:hypothetical protein